MFSHFRGKKCITLLLGSAVLAFGLYHIHAQSGITEGGILGAVWEMCQISGTGCEVWEDKVPIEPVARKICDFFEVDPLRLISSGSMVIIAPKDKKFELLDAIKEAGVEATVIGVIKEPEAGIKIAKKTLTCGSGELGRISVTIDPPYADEIYKIVKR